MFHSPRYHVCCACVISRVYFSTRRDGSVLIKSTLVSEMNLALAIRHHHVKNRWYRYRNQKLRELSCSLSYSEAVWFSL